MGPLRARFLFPAVLLFSCMYSLLVFRARCFMGLLFFCRIYRLGFLIWNNQHMKLCGPFQLWIFTLVRLFLPFLPILMLSLYSSLVSLFTQCYVPLGGNYFICTCICVVSVGKGAFRVFHAAILNPLEK